MNGIRNNAHKSFASPVGIVHGQKGANTMNTKEILTETFNVIARTHDPSYEPGHLGPKIGTTVIDYASFDRMSQEYNIDTDTFTAHTEFGCEGVYVGVFIERYDPVNCTTSLIRVGTIKTLAEGCSAWNDMGALAGVITYLANCVINWSLYKQQQE